MVRKLLLSTMVLLLITLSGWSQSSQNWTLQKDYTNRDIIKYNFYKEDLTNLRVYITTLEQYKKLYFVDEQQILKLKAEVVEYDNIIYNNRIAGLKQEQALSVALKLNEDLKESNLKYKNRLKHWPYWLGGGFLGGIIVCQLVK